MQVPPPQTSLKLATEIAVGPVKVELLGLLKSTWNLKRFNVLGAEKVRKKFGSPAGGAVVPSRSEGNRLATLEPCWKQTMLAAPPLSINGRSKAQGFAPVNTIPKANVFELR